MSLLPRSALLSPLFAGWVHAGEPAREPQATTGAEGGATAEDDLLDQTWRAYARRFIRHDGRVVDLKGGRMSTSEGQAYGMVRAVWQGDREEFERLRTWTLEHLQGGDPHALPAWQWGQREGGGRGVRDPSPAADADQWMAWALLLAAERFERPELRSQAKGMLDQIWAREVQTAGERLVLLPGPWAANTAPLRLNPSYFLPFAWRAFAAVDPNHPWMRLLDDAYAILSLPPVGMEGGPYLPPDWLYLSPDARARVPAPDPAHDQCGFEAARVAWTLAAEVVWFGETRAEALLQPFLALDARYLHHGWLPAVLSPQGEPAVDYEHLSMVGALYPAWHLFRPEPAKTLYTRSIADHRRGPGWGEPKDYYAQNWTWMGLALARGRAQPPEKI